MSIWRDRQIMVQAIIVAAVCIGGWVMLVQPRVAELHSLEAIIAQSGPDSPRPSDEIIKRVAEQAVIVKGRVSDVVSRSQMARDSSWLYRQLMALAAEHGVVVESVNPAAVVPSAPGKPVSINSIDMVLQGNYEQIAKFLEAVDRLGGYLRPGALTLTPLEMDTRALITAHFVCEALSFDLPEPLMVMQGGANAHR